MVSLQRVAAQAVAPPAFQLPQSAQLSAPDGLSPANGTNNPTTTKVVRIYSGLGYFDVAMAEKLRPMLAKAFTSSKSDLVKSAPAAAVAAPAKAESQSQLPLASHL